MKRRVVAILSMAIMALSVAVPAAQASNPCAPKAVNDILADALGDGWPPCVNP